MKINLLLKAAASAVTLLFSVSLLAAPVNINTATAEELAANLAGIGMAKASAIVEYRQQHGDFGSVDELTAVKGIGDATVEKNRDQILLQSSDKAG